MLGCAFMNFVILVLLKYTQIEVLVNNIQATINLVLKAKLFRLMAQRSIISYFDDLCNDMA